MTIEVNARNTVRGRPRSTGDFTCARCHRQAAKPRIRWPEGQICGTCFHDAMRTHGFCPLCRFERLLPGRVEHVDGPVCVDCAGITDDFHCATCGIETEHYRRPGICARCALRDDLTTLMLDNAADLDAMSRLVDAFCAADRPESIHTWKRPPQVRDLLRRIAIGDIPLTHEGLDAVGNTHRVAHLRAILEHHGLLPQRDRYLARFEAWIDAKLAALTVPEVRRPVERFAHWHHLRRVRGIAAAGKPTRGPVHASKQDITETIKFLTWLHKTYGRTVETCVQADADEWLADGPSTRHLVRTFFVRAKANKMNKTVVIGHRQAKTVRTFTQDQRLRWIKELLTGTSESVTYRLAAVLLLLYAQPLVKVAALRTNDVVVTKDEMRLSLGKEPVPVPAPFAHLITDYLRRRPNLRTTATADNEWLFPGYRPGTHLHPHTLMMRIRDLGVDLLGARNAALRSLVTEAPPHSSPKCSAIATPSLKSTPRSRPTLTRVMPQRRRPAQGPGDRDSTDRPVATGS